MVNAYGPEMADSLAVRNRDVGSTVPARWVGQAASLARQLAAAAGTSLVHADLHYGNVLAGAREPWLAIDPHAVSGDPEQSVPELMWTRIDELDDSAVRALLDIIVEAGRLDAERRGHGRWCGPSTTGCGDCRSASRSIRCGANDCSPR